jgi:hypothetical protein
MSVNVTHNHPVTNEEAHRDGTADSEAREPNKKRRRVDERGNVGFLDPEDDSQASDAEEDGILQFDN